MTEEESKMALFQLHREYMKHSPKERLKLYSDYMEKRNKIKEELLNLIIAQKLEYIKTK